MKKVKRNNVTRNTSNNSISSNLIKKNLNVTEKTTQTIKNL